MHGSDFGLFQLAEVLGMKQLIFVKDEDGLYDRDPKLHPHAKLIPKITLEEGIPKTVEWMKAVYLGDRGQVGT